MTSSQQLSPVGKWLILSAIVMALLAASFFLFFMTIGASKKQTELVAAYAEESCQLGQEAWGNEFDFSFMVLVICEEGDQQHRFEISKYKSQAPLLVDASLEQRRLLLCEGNNFLGRSPDRLAGDYEKFIETHGGFPLTFVVGPSLCHSSHLEGEGAVKFGFELQ